jgi:hypothetical protein
VIETRIAFGEVTLTVKRAQICRGVEDVRDDALPASSSWSICAGPTFPGGPNGSTSSITSSA